MALDADVAELASSGNFAALTTLFEDGQPQTQIMWVDADADHLLINTEVHRAKFRNVARDPRVTVTIWRRDDPYRYVEVRGRVAEVVHGDEARAHIDVLAHRYLGTPYPADHITSERAILRIEAGRVHRRGL
jgi:PPOX class probable F420-dependent enzyme